MGCSQSTVRNQVSSSVVQLQRNDVQFKAFLDENLDNTKKNDVSQLVRQFLYDTNEVVQICTMLEKDLENILCLFNVLSVSNTKKVEQENRNIASSSRQISPRRPRELESVTIQLQEAMARSQEGMLKISKTIKKKKWRKISKAIHTTLVMVILIGTVITAAIAAPPVAVVVGPLATAMVYPLERLEEQNFKFIWKYCRKFTKDDTLFDTEKMTVDMEEMKHEVELLSATLEMFSNDLHNVNAIKSSLSAEEIKSNSDIVINCVKSLIKNCKNCTKKIRELQKVIMELIN
ncbi:hypothetical protein ZOSMA_363G00050 [Zostera marina]|uniref:Uncharacterized protein n=1 Tax=Zostera marina TaxID=29655 RepID=A0A0K9P8N8_ZOSMR|nr:hypothetical protein ZOSMA_363G00050 [Zostera marina]